MKISIGKASSTVGKKIRRRDRKVEACNLCPNDWIFSRLWYQQFFFTQRSINEKKKKFKET